MYGMASLVNTGLAKTTVVSLWKKKDPFNEVFLQLSLVLGQGDISRFRKWRANYYKAIFMWGLTIIMLHVIACCI